MVSKYHNFKKKMYLFFKSKFTFSNYFNLLLALIPLSFIAGNLVINANIILLIISTLFLFGMDSLKIKYSFVDKLILLFFFLILFTGIINDYYLYYNEGSWRGYFSTTLKSIFFFKYLFLFVILRYLIEKNIIDLKFFFITSTLASLFVCFDIFFQLQYGKDIFGFEGMGAQRKLGGPFGDELIAGGFIQRFSIFSFFLFPIFYKRVPKKIIALSIPFLFVIFLLGIIFSGNRMPLILFLFIVCLIVIFQKQTRKFFLPFVIVLPLIFLLLVNTSPIVKINFEHFYKRVSNMTIILINKDIENKNVPQHLKEFESFYNTWLMNKYIGGGIKNFRYYCHHRPNIPKDSKFICNMHPHNYYLEVLTETGLVGFVVISIIFSLILLNTFYKKYFTKSHLQNNILIIPFIFLFIAEIFPIKSTGSFFTTGNTTYLFLIISILIGLSYKNNSIENKN